MRTLLIILLITLNIGYAYAQNELKARIEFEAAETAFTDSNFKQAYEKLDKAEKLLGKWSARISYMKILSLNQFVPVGKKDDPYTQELRKEVKLYMDYAKANKNDIDMDKFKEMYAVEERLANAFDPDIHYNTPGWKAAKDADRNNEKARAFELYSREADNGNPAGIYAVGLYHCYGIGGAKQNKELGEKLLLRARYLGEPKSIGALAALYYYQATTTLQYKKALDMAMEATSQNVTQGWLTLANMYLNGKGVEKNSKEGLRCYQEAEKDTAYDLRYLIASLYLYGDATVQDYAKAAKIYKELIMENTESVGNALHSIGYMYENGFGAPKDYSVAFEMYAKAAEKGHKDAYERLAYFYENGLGVKRDKKLAAEWREKAKK